MRIFNEKVVSSWFVVYVEALNKKINVNTQMSCICRNYIATILKILHDGSKICDTVDPQCSKQDDKF